MEIGPEQISDFRNQLKNLPEEEISTFDQRDLDRVLSNDKYALCFLRWRKGDIEASVQLATQAFKWRNEKQIYDLKPDDFDVDFMKRGIIYVRGIARDGTIIVHFISRQQTKDMKAQVQRLLSMWLERIQQAYPGKHMTFLLDVSKAGLSNVDVGGIRFMLDCFTTYFPGMLERIVIVEMPWIMNAIWKVVKQWMTEEQRNRTKFASFKELRQFFDADQLLKYMGGTDDWQYSYPPFPDDIPDVKQQQDSISVFEDTADNVSVGEDEFVVTDLEITATSEVVVGPPQDSSSINQEQGTLDEQNEESALQEEILQQAAAGDGAPPAGELPNGGVSFVNESEPLIQQGTPEVSSGSSKLAEKQKPKSPRKPPQCEEIKLGDLLFMSPVSEIVFKSPPKDQATSRYHSLITLRNPNKDGNVAFKIKTTSPERYHVKPSTGMVSAEETSEIRISLSDGLEDKVEKDRFLVLYQKMEKGEEMQGFWAKHATKESRLEHRIRVRFDGGLSPKNQNTSPNSVITPSSGANVKPQVQTDVELQRLSTEVAKLRRQIVESQSSHDLLRSRFKLSLFLQTLLILLLLFTLHRISLVTVIADIGSGRSGL